MSPILPKSQRAPSPLRRQLRLRFALGAITALAACDDGSLPAESDGRRPIASVSAASPMQASPEVAAVAATVPSSSGLFAAQQCAPQPGQYSTVNLASNPDFEQGVSGIIAWPPGPVPPPSAATGWFMHTDNSGSLIRSRRLTSDVPGKRPPGKMLAFAATKHESGIYQIVPNAPAKVMFSAWVKVMTPGAFVQLTVNGSANTPTAHTTSVGEWEQLRICSDGTVPAGMFTIWQQSGTGGTFFVDRVEIHEVF